MKIVKRGPKEKDFVNTYKFSCHSCKSVLKAKSYEFRRFGFKNNLEDKDPGYVFICPVCNCQRVVRRSELKMVIPVCKTVAGKVDRVLGMAVHKIEEMNGERREKVAMNES